MLNVDGPEGYGVAAIAGAVVAKVLDVILKNRRDEAKLVRDELRADIARLNAQMKQIAEEVDSWRSKYFKLHEENIQLRIECKDLRARLDALVKSQDMPAEHVPASDNTVKF